METDASQQATAQLAHLVDHFVQHPTGRRTGRGAPVRSIENTAPLNIDAISHIDASVREIRDYMRTESPGTLEPLPADAAAVYDWCIRNTETDDDAARRRRDAIIYRQYLEHCILTGDVKVIRTHRCPDCGTVGLHWNPPFKKALCRNIRCKTPDGGLQMWSLARLATAHIEAHEKLAARATLNGSGVSR